MAAAQCPIGPEDTKDELAALEQELERATQAAEEIHAALSELDEERREREGRLALALRAQQDFEQRLEEKRVELARIEAEAALERLERALGARDVAAEGFASAVRAVMTRLQDFEAAQDDAENAWQAVLLSRGPANERAAGAELQGDLKAQPGVFTEALTMLTELVSQRADLDLERDLVEAAARSPSGKDISTLPTHLQGLARSRRFAIARDMQQRR